tara:strand:- start:381 stop:578 length:198 start_codon:yes stop_codon:yes gene_type:complete
MMTLFKRTNRKHYKMSEKIKIVSSYFKKIEVPHPLEGLVYNYDNILVSSSNKSNKQKEKNNQEEK